MLDELNSRDEIGYIRTMLEQGSGADRQIRVFAETGDLKQVRRLHGQRDQGRPLTLHRPPSAHPFVHSLCPDRSHLTLADERQRQVNSLEMTTSDIPRSASSTAPPTAAPPTDLLSISFPETFRPGAHNAVVTCLKVQPDEKVTLIADRSCLEIAASLADELQSSGCTWNGFVLEDLTPRPYTAMPARILADMETSQVSIFAVNVQPNELGGRMQMTDIVNRRRMRHAHMVNITAGDHDPRDACADFLQIDRLSPGRPRQVFARPPTSAPPHAAGTDIHAQLSPDYRWFKTSGIISTEKWGNLPGGECFTAPARGERNLCRRRRRGRLPLQNAMVILQQTPLTIAHRREPHRTQSRLSDNKDAGARLLGLHPHRRKLGSRRRVRIGTNIGVKRVIGNHPPG